MGKFTSYDAPLGVAGPISTRRATVDDFGGDARGFQIASKEITNFAAKQTLRAESADVTATRTLQSQAMSDLTMTIAELEQKAELGAPNFVESVQDKVNQYYDKRKDSITTKKGKDAFRVSQQDVLSHFTKSAITFKSASAGAKVKSDFRASVNNDKNTILQNPDPETFNFIVENIKTKIYDKNGAIYNGLKNAEDRNTLAKETIEDLSETRVRGLIRRNPEQTLIDIEAGVFADTLKPEKVPVLRKEAQRAINAARVAEEAEIKAEKKRKTEEQKEKTNTIFQKIITGKNSDGEVVSPTEIKEEILSSGLPSFGVFSQNKLLIKLRQTTIGTNKEEADATLRQVGDNYLSQIITGQKGSGVDDAGLPIAKEKVDYTELRKTILDDPFLKPFMGAGSKRALLKLIDNKTEISATPLTRRQEEIYELVQTGQDKNGNDLTDNQIQQIIRNDLLLPVDGPLGKNAFRKMVIEQTINQSNETISIREQEIYERIMLPKDDPNYLSADEIDTQENVTRLGVDRVEKLKKIAEDIEKKENKIIEDAVKGFSSRYKSLITQSLIGKKLDSSGDKRYLDLQEYARQAAKREIEQGRNPLDLFNSSNARFIGKYVDQFVPTQEERRAATMATSKGRIILFKRPELFPIPTDETVTPAATPPTTAPAAAPQNNNLRREGETAEDYLKRVDQ